MTTKLTALIPCKNERTNIRACIESVRPIADEILIADSGSTDGTLEIVRGMPDCRVIEREYIHSANFKNWAIPQARHPWVLIVDADERVTPELAAEIQEVLAATDPEVDGYFIGRKNYFLGYHIAHCGWNKDDVLRLFRRDAGRYRNRWVHAEIDLPPERVRRLSRPFEHYTAWSSEHNWTKLNRYATWGALNYRDEGRQASLFSMAIRPALRFMQLYFLRLGFLDGVPGFHVCAHTAFYTFLKQARLWELSHAKQPTDVDVQESTQSPDVIPFPSKASEPTRKSRAA